MSAVAELVTTIGLEIHVELKTNTKMFCGCPVAFGGEPNTRVCPVCLGHPGTLPTVNERAVEFTMKIAMALGCEVAPQSIFHRKNYFYPDMPKNYQISQYDLPMGVDGALEVDVDGQMKRVGITRVHLEEDTGKSMHVGAGGRIHSADYSLEDFNRAGTPLVEIVSEPDITSPEEARAFIQELRAILDYLEVSDVKMEEGSLRVDANVSVSPPGERGVKIEIKNMNSVRSMFRALEYEQKRQAEAIEDGTGLEQSTRHWDEKAGVTKPLRTKEFAFDYRYFPEPDLTPIEPSVEWLRQLSEELPELPAERRRKLIDDAGLSAYDAGVITGSKATGDFFAAALASAKTASPKQIANWLTNELQGILTEKVVELADAPITPEALARVVDLVAEEAVSARQAKEILAEVVDSGADPDAIVETKGLKQVSDRSELEAAVDQAIADNPEIAERIRGGEDKPFGFLVGKVMKATKGQGNPATINELLRERLR